jgi:hypothetical protein
MFTEAGACDLIMFSTAGFGPLGSGLFGWSHEEICLLYGLGGWKPGPFLLTVLLQTYGKRLPIVERSS